MTLLTLGCPGSQGTVFIDEVVEGEGQDEERTFTGCVHLKGYISLVKANCLAFLGQRRLEQFSGHLGENSQCRWFEMYWLTDG